LLISLVDREGSLIGMRRMTTIAANADSKAKIAGRSLTPILAMSSSKMMNCERKILVKRTSRAFGVVVGRAVAMKSIAKAQDAAGYTMSIRN
jgi:hypothetical protein